MKNVSSAQFDPAVLAVLHRTSRGWRVLIADSRRVRPTILSTSKLSESDVDHLDAVLDEHRVGRVICVLPAARVICRTCTLPDADPEQVDQALHLQAEAQLLDTAPVHRLAMAALPAATGETSRMGLILAWPEAATFEPPVTTRPVTFAPDVAALAALLNGNRPDEPALWLDRTDGSIAAAVSHSNGLVFRAAREDATDAHGWQTQVVRMLTETALSVGHTPEYITRVQESVNAAIKALRADEDALILEPSILDAAERRLEGVESNSTWWSQYGIAAGVLLANVTQLRELTVLRADPPSESPSLVNRLVSRLASRQAAAITVIVCLLVMAIGPTAVSGMRLGILKLRHPDLAERKAAIDQVRNKLNVYSALKSRSWSMTKLLSDVACSTPTGIELDSIRIDWGSTLLVTGEARRVEAMDMSAQDVVAQMQNDLRKTGIFSDFVLSWGDGNAYGSYQFDLSAQVINPYAHPNYPIENDYARYTMQDKVDGKQPPGETPDPVVESTDPSDGLVLEDQPNAPIRPVDDQPALVNAPVEDDPQRVAAADPGPVIDERPANGESRGSRWPGPRAGSGTSDSGSSRSDTGERQQATSGGGPVEVPEPLTESQIAAMSATEAKDALSKIGQARRRAHIDDATKDRLKQEFNLLLEKLRRES